MLKIIKLISITIFLISSCMRNEQPYLYKGFVSTSSTLPVFKSIDDKDPTTSLIKGDEIFILEEDIVNKSSNSPKWYKIKAKKNLYYMPYPEYELGLYIKLFTSPKNILIGTIRTAKTILTESPFITSNTISTLNLNDKVKIKSISLGTETIQNHTGKWLEIETPSGQTGYIKSYQVYNDNGLPLIKHSDQTALRQLLRNIENGYIKGVQTLLADGVDSNQFVEDIDMHIFLTNYAIVNAIDGKHFDIAKLLIKYGTNLNDERYLLWGNNLFAQAADAGSLELCKIFYENGIPANVVNDNGVTPLFLAYYISPEESPVETLNLMKYLLELKIPINHKDSRGNTVLMDMLRNNYVNNSMFDLLLEYSPDLTIKNQDNETAIDIAAKKHPELVEILKKRL